MVSPSTTVTTRPVKSSCWAARKTTQSTHVAMTTDALDAVVPCRLSDIAAEVTRPQRVASIVRSNQRTTPTSPCSTAEAGEESLLVLEVPKVPGVPRVRFRSAAGSLCRRPRVNRRAESWSVRNVSCGEATGARRSSSEGACLRDESVRSAPSTAHEKRSRGDQSGVGCGDPMPAATSTRSDVFPACGAAFVQRTRGLVAA